MWPLLCELEDCLDDLSSVIEESSLGVDCRRTAVSLADWKALRLRDDTGACTLETA